MTPTERRIRGLLRRYDLDGLDRTAALRALARKFSDNGDLMPDFDAHPELTGLLVADRVARRGIATLEDLDALGADKPAAVPHAPARPAPRTYDKPAKTDAEMARRAAESLEAQGVDVFAAHRR